MDKGAGEGVNPETIKLIDEWYERFRDEPRDAQQAAVKELGHRSSIAAKVLARMLDASLAVPTPALDSGRTEVPSTLGEYTIVRAIGSGGFGTVYLAERQHPFVHRVAIKLIERALDSNDVGCLFEQERRIQASLNHPCIPRFLNCGQDRVHGWYLVMELVEGVSITEHCRQSGLGPTAKLRLMARVCDAVAYAHERGVIHRDLKPSNVLVTRSRGWDEPKIIDFGISTSVISGRSADELGAMVTRLGTPSAMAPESLSGAPADARADVFGLGVLLYELVTGVHPFVRDGERVSFLECARRVREIKPIPLMQSGSDGLLRSSINDLSDPATLVLNDLTLRCLSADPQHRPATAGEIAGQLRSIISVDCSPESVESTIDLARQLQKSGNAARAERELADVYEMSARSLGATHRLTLRAAMLLAVSRDEQGRRDEAEVLLRSTLVALSRALGRNDLETIECTGHLALLLSETFRLNEAEPLSDHVFSARRLQLGDEHPETLIALNNLAAMKYRQGLVSEAANLFERLVVTRERVLGPDAEDVFLGLANLGTIRLRLGETRPAEEYLQRAVAGFSARLGDSHAATLSTTTTLLKLMHMCGRDEEAMLMGEKTFERSLASLGRSHHVTKYAAEVLLKVLDAIETRTDDSKAIEHSALIRSRIHWLQRLSDTDLFPST